LKLFFLFLMQFLYQDNRGNEGNYMKYKAV
jgi:hypothetical protein